MYFLLASLVALGGIIFLLRPTKQKVSLQQNLNIIDTDVWIDSLESTLQQFLRKILKIIVIHIASWYRFIVYNITIHKKLRTKIKELLHEHQREHRAKKNKDIH